MMLELFEAWMALAAAVLVTKVERVPPLIRYVLVKERHNPQPVASPNLEAASAVVVTAMIDASAESREVAMRIGSLVM